MWVLICRRARILTLILIPITTPVWFIPKEVLVSNWGFSVSYMKARADLQVILTGMRKASDPMEATRQSFPEGELPKSSNQTPMITHWQLGIFPIRHPNFSTFSWAMEKPFWVMAIGPY